MSSLLKRCEPHQHRGAADANRAQAAWRAARMHRNHFPTEDEDDQPQSYRKWQAMLHEGVRDEHDSQLRVRELCLALNRYSRMTAQTAAAMEKAGFYEWVT